jgi:hypothetical protein
MSGRVKLLIVQESLRIRLMPRKLLVGRLYDLIRSMGEPLPKRGTLEKLISRARNQEPSLLDMPWSLGSISKYEMIPGILPKVIEAYEMSQLKEDVDGFKGWRSFTIRDALWVARLSALFKDSEDVYDFAVEYSSRERACEVLGILPETPDIDTMLLEALKKEKEYQTKSRF